MGTYCFGIDVGGTTVKLSLIHIFLFFEGSRYNLSVCDLCVSLLKEQFDLAYFILCTGTGN